MVVMLVAPVVGPQSSSVSSTEPHDEPTTVGVVDIWGARRTEQTLVRETLGITVGDVVERETWRDVRQRTLDRLLTLPHVEDARVSMTCCADGELIVYVSLQETGAPKLELNELSGAPHADISLPSEIDDSYRSFEAVLRVAVASGNDGDDLTQGHSLAADPVVRAQQQRFVGYADRYLRELRDVVRYAVEPSERAVAATVLGYASDKRAVIDDLVVAARDPDPSVRNNAMRSLIAIAMLAASEPQLEAHFTRARFVDLLQSVESSDRNKAVALLWMLTENRDPVLLEQLRERALDSLSEMACFEYDPHAWAPWVLLGRMAGLPEAEIENGFSRDDRSESVAALLARIR